MATVMLQQIALAQPIRGYFWGYYRIHTIAIVIKNKQLCAQFDCHPLHHIPVVERPSKSTNPRNSGFFVGLVSSGVQVSLLESGGIWG